MLQEQIQEEQTAPVHKTVRALVERSYLQHLQKINDEKPDGEFRIGELSLAVSEGRQGDVFVDLVSTDAIALNEVEKALNKPYYLRRNLIEIPLDDIARIARMEAVDVLSYLQKREKIRLEERERIANYESETED